MDQGAVEVAENVAAAELNADVIPAAIGHAPTRRGEGGLRSVYGKLDAVLGVTPTTDVPPQIIIAVAPVKDDEEACTAAVLARTTAIGIVAPVGVAGPRPAISGGSRGLLIHTRVGVPDALENIPDVRARTDKVTPVKRHAVTGDDEIGVDRKST